MKTKIIYISGNEIFKIEDIRAAFEEVRNALNLDKTTVLFGVPVDNEDTGLATNVAENEPEIIESVVEETEPEIETTKEVIIEPVLETKEEIESEIEQPVKKRGRPRKEAKAEEDVEEIVEETESVKEEKIVPILSVLETHEEVVVDEAPVAEEESIEIIPEFSDEEPEETVDTVKPETEEIDDDDGVKLEKLLSAMTPLEEDSLEEPFAGKEREETVTETSDIFDATLEQLATEFIETQDKIAAESKSSTRSKIGKLRNILPFKQSKHKDNSGLGDLFGWAGMAANDEDFSVPGFFTSAASKK